jgi:hypothetical protein
VVVGAYEIPDVETPFLLLHLFRCSFDVRHGTHLLFADELGRLNGGAD